MNNEVSLLGLGGQMIEVKERLRALEHLSFTRHVFLLEILREKGLLNELPLSDIEARVAEVVVGQSVPPYAVSKDKALKNVAGVLSEIAGDYSWNDD